MNYSSEQSLVKKLQTISNALAELQQDVARQQSTETTNSCQPIDDLPALGQRLNARRKALGLDLETLELQTGVSTSTLKRLFKDPEGVKFGTVFLIARTLGVKLCTDA
ncbi:helix-turn-helix transcriptional regulator [Enterobacter sp.]|uniref:helix-turn-helix domain-containing protein n=1 Tax=Enterobacter sp. TaxID=42895 RepID=UPI00296FD347|nr:helix-turn-helix transcriptional regulator [Enterobacter sp.]